jgi:2-keto-4-pentenoate hydratase/2-oxohepta-3-ene-1,7-dioic acid hydratase in catechol pathway
VRLITFLNSDRAARVGLLLRDDTVIDLSALRSPEGVSAASLSALISSGGKGLDWLKRVSQERGTLSLSSLQLLAPVPRPGKNIFCVGWNYLEHFEEGAAGRAVPVDLPDHPVFFTKAPTTANGPYADIRIGRATTEKLDWEVELGVIIGKAGIDIAQEQAMSHVFGYTVINDVTGRDIQRQHGQQWFKGKSLDGSCPMGPVIVTADELDPAALQLTCRVNGKVKQDSNTEYMYFKIPRLIAELSHGLTLEPGDIIATGTPSGVGHARKPPEFLKSGDVLESEIAGIGVLRNRIVDPASA